MAIVKSCSFQLGDRVISRKLASMKAALQDERGTVIDQPTDDVVVVHMDKPVLNTRLYRGFRCVSFKVTSVRPDAVDEPPYMPAVCSGLARLEQVARWHGNKGALPQLAGGVLPKSNNMTAPRQITTPVTHVTTVTTVRDYPIGEVDPWTPLTEYRSGQ